MRTAERRGVHVDRQPKIFLDRREFPLYLLTPAAFIWLWGLAWFASTARASGFAALFFLGFATLDEVLRRVFVGGKK